MTANSTDLLAADTAMGAVTLHVGDLDAMIAYYRDAVGAPGAQRRPATRVDARPRHDARHDPAARARAEARQPARRRTVPHRDPVRHRGGARRIRLLGRPEVPEHLHRQLRPPREQGVLLHRPGGQRRRAVLGPRPHRVELDARQHRDGHPLPRPERIPAGAPHRGRRRPTRSSATRGSGTCTSRSATSQTAREFYVDRLGFEATAEMAGSARCSSARAATTTTWP